MEQSLYASKETKLAVHSTSGITNMWNNKFLYCLNQFESGFLLQTKYFNLQAYLTYSYRQSQIYNCLI